MTDIETIQKALIFSLLLSCYFVLSCTNNTTTVVDGILPPGYEWAYGEWHGKNPNGTDVSLFIGNNFIQDSEVFFYPFADYSKITSLLPPIVCFPKSEYVVKSASDNEIDLDYGERWATYENEYIITLNKKTKRVEGYSRSRKKYDAEKAIAEYRNRYDRSPFWGTWILKDKKYGGMKLNPSDPYVLSNDGKRLFAIFEAYDMESEDCIFHKYSDGYDYVTDKYIRTTLFFSKEDIFNYLRGQTFTGSGGVLTFTDDLQMIHNNRTITHDFKVRNFTKTKATLSGCLKGFSRLYGERSIMVDPTQQSLYDFGSKQYYFER